MATPAPRITERIIRALPAVDVGMRAAVGPFQFVTTGEDNLRFRTWSTQAGSADPPTTELGIRTLSPDGTLQVTVVQQTPVLVTGAAETVVPVGAGAIVNLAVRYLPQSYPLGCTYVTVDLVRGQPPGNVTLIGQLLGDYVNAGKSIAWPGSPIVAWHAGSGFQRRVDLGTGTLGFELGRDIQYPYAWRPLTFSATFVTSAAAGTRYPMVRLVSTADPTKHLAELPPLTAIGPSGGAHLRWAVGYGSLIAGTPDRFYGPMPAGILLAPGTSFNTVTLGLTPTDQWFVGELWVEELIVPAGP